MTTIERLFMQIFDRKECIESQMRQQVESYGESVSCNLLAAGVTPPPWLWDHGSDAFGCPEQRDLSRNEIIQEVLFCLPQATNPYMNLHTIYALPTRKSTNLSHHSSFSNETCISNKHILSENIVVAKTTGHHKDDQRNCDIVCSEIFEDSPGCGSLPVDSRHLENLLNEKSYSANFGDEDAVEQGARQITRSMVTSLMPDSIREPSDAKNLFSLHSKDGNGAAPSGSFDFLDNISKLSISSGFISNIATSNQACFIPTIQQKSDNLIVNNCHDASARECCIHAVEKAFVSNESNFADSRLNTTLSSSLELSQNYSLVVTKKLSFDGIEVCCPDDKTYDLSSQEQNLFCPSEVEIEPIKSMQSLKKDPVSKDYVHGSGAVLLEEDALHTDDVQSSGSSARCSSFKERIKSECHAPSTSSSILYRELPLLSKEEKHSSLDDATSHSCLKFSETRGSQSSVYQSSPPASLMKLSEKLYNGEPTTGREIRIADTTQHQASFCMPMHSPDKTKTCRLTKDDVTSSEEDVCNYIENSSGICKFMQDEELQRNSNSMPDLLEGKQFLQVDTMPIMEVMSGKDKVPTSIDNMEGKDESFDIVETCKSRVCGTSHIPNRELLVTVSSIDSHKQQPDRSLVELIMEESHTGKLVENSICNLDILSDNSVVQTDKACLETLATQFFAVVGTGNRRVAVPTSFVHSVENDSAGSSASACDASAFDCSALPSLDEQPPGLLAKEDAIETVIRVDSEKILIDELQGSSGLENKLKKVNYISKSSTSIPEDVYHCKEHASVSPSDKNMYLELKKDDTCEVVMVSGEKSMMQPPDLVRTYNHSSEPRYFLRSLSGHGAVQSHLDLIQTGNGTSSKRPREMVTNACEISWPKRRKLKCYSDGILGTTTKIKRHQFVHTQEDNIYSSKKHFEISSLEEMQITPSSSKSVLESDESNADLRSNSEHHHKNQIQCVVKDDRAIDQVVDISLPVRCTDVFPSADLADKNSSASIAYGICFSESTRAEIEEPGSSSSRGDADDRLNCFETIGYCSSSQSVEVRQISESEKGLSTYDSSLLSSLKDDMVDNDKFMPEFEGFSISVSPVVQNSYSDSDFPPFTEHDSLNVQRSTLTGSAASVVLPSENYKIDKFPDIFQPLPNGLLEHMNINDYLCFHNDYVRQFSTSEQDNVVPGLDNSLGSAFDCSYMEASNSHITLSSGSRFGWTASKLPLTPPIQKSSSRKGSRKSASSSQTLGSNPELVCFRIDENSSTVEDNDSFDELSTSEEVIYSKGINVPDSKATLKDESSIYENAQIVCPLTKEILERNSLSFSNPKSLPASQICIDLSIGSVCTSNIDQIGDKENQCLSISGIQEMNLGKCISHKSSEPETNMKAAGKNKNKKSIQEVCKKTNIISNVSSFIPMVNKKQQATTTKAKKDIKVKSLEAAEAAKRLEELKQNAREMRKAAAKLERERLEKEKQLKQKQLEEKRRKEADIAARKRQREEEEKKEKDRKKRCIEEARKLQREQDERLHRKKEEKDLRLKAAVDDGRKKGVVEEAKQQLKSEREVAVTRKTEVAESAATKAASSSNAMHGIIKDRMSTNKQNQDLQSYEISPYKDSDDEDGQEESLSRRKFIPSWAGRQCLSELSLLQDDLDPLKIFSRKNSFSLNEVLPVVARR